MINLCSNEHGFSEVCCISRKDCELPHGHPIARVRTTMDPTESWTWRGDGRLVREVSNVEEQGHPLLNSSRLTDHRDPSQKSASTPFRFCCPFLLSTPSLCESFTVTDISFLIIKVGAVVLLMSSIVSETSFLGSSAK